MRVIAGSARRMLLQTPKGLNTRPTQDRIKETLFNMLQYDLADAVFLDLFAGSGGIGIEALSRGAAQAVFVEQNAGAADIVRQNLKTTGLSDRAVVMHCDALTALGRMEGKFRFDFIFMDPPYNHGLERQMLAYLRHSALIDRQSTVIIEASLETDFDYLDSLGFTLEKIKQYKTNKHVFVYRGDENGDSSISGQL
ncbi:MAG: 16S rRNA (guanine(966)-N(2))-methyltransferase RsmD [Clostridiales bacterium]|nr:16S rRNA (guanine(966)-N(2))-methyltransferase RsmD [Clostridiales bacterium]